MKKQKRENIDLLTAFQLYLYNKGLIVNHDWDFEKQAKKFVKKLARQKRLEGLIENDKPDSVKSFVKGLLDILNGELTVDINNKEIRLDSQIEVQFDINDPSALESFTKLKEELDEIQKNLSEVKNPDGGIKHPLDIDNPLPYVTFEKSEQEVQPDTYKSIERDLSEVINKS